MSQPGVERQAEHHGRKRRRISPIHGPVRDSETSSSGSDSETPAEAELEPSGEDEIKADEDESSSSGTDDSDSDTEEILHPPLTTNKPPDTDIHNRLTSFFSQLAEQRANPSTVVDEVIEENSSDSGYEDDEEGKQYVELDLALGVLSEDPDGGDGEKVRIPGIQEGDVSEPESDVDADAEDGPGRGMAVLQKLSSVTGGSASKPRQKKRRVEEVS